ncbi:MAG: hypothetical protein AAFU41_14950 [Pseudomonadota bacterium]
MSVSIFRPVSLICFLGLAACGGGGGSSEEPPSFDELLTRFQALEAQAVPPSFNPTGFPTMGTSRFEGVMHFGSSMPSFSLWGEMHMTVDFGNSDAVTGGARNFRNPSNVPVTGSLTMMPDQLFRNQSSTLTVNFEDTRLTEPGVTYDTEGLNFFGSFRGVSGEFFYATVLGDVIYDDTPASINDGQTVSVSGEIAAEQVN